jgi:3-hydroxymyristoyl/3-hydroxydecanoyl-(acyl carrier protein) dehydratase
MNAASGITESLRIPSTHAALPGHFPGNPIVPGVVLLDRVAAAIEKSGERLARIGVVKFPSPLKPEETATLAIARDGTRVSFRIDRDGTPILRGEGELA